MNRNALEEEIGATLPDDAPKRNNKLKYKLVDVARYGLHKVTTRPRLMPYTYLIQWAIDFINFPKWYIINLKGTIIGSFTPNDIQSMYKFPTPSLTFNESFIVGFMQTKYIDLHMTLPTFI